MKVLSRIEVKMNNYLKKCKRCGEYFLAKKGSCPACESRIAELKKQFEEYKQMFENVKNNIMIK